MSNWDYNDILHPESVPHLTVLSSIFYLLYGVFCTLVWSDSVVVVVDCGLTSHSAIFQLYSDGTDVQFPNFNLLPDAHAMGS